MRFLRRSSIVASWSVVLAAFAVPLPYEVMQSLVRALKPGGRVVLVEYRGEDPNVPIKALHKMTEAQIRREMVMHALAWEHTSERLPLQHIVVFRKVATAP